MKIIIGSRQSGKTTKCIEFMKENLNSNCITPNQRMADVINEKLGEKRARAFPSSILSQLANKEIVIDEADFIDEGVLKKLEKLNKILLVTATPYRSRTNPKTWLRKKMMQYGFQRLPSLMSEERIESLKKIMTIKRFKAEILAEFS